MHVAGLGGIRVEDDAIRVGAAVRQAELLAWPELAAAPAAARAGAALGRALRRRARAARSAARSRSPIRAPNCRSCLPALGGERRPFVTSGSPQRRGGGLLHRADVDRAPRRRTDRGGVVSLRARRRRVTRSASSRAGMATSRSWPARRSRRRTVSRLAVGGVADRPVSATSMTPATTRSTPSPPISTRATTCTRPRTIAAISCAGSAAQTIEEARMPRLSADARHTRALDVNGRAHRGRGRAAHAAHRFPAPQARPHRHACRLRARRAAAPARSQIDGAPARACLTLAVQADGCDASAPSKGLRPSRAGSRCCRRRSAAITHCNAASAPPAS